MTHPQSTAQGLSEELRRLCDTLRVKPIPLVQLIPLMQRAADVLDAHPAAPGPEADAWQPISSAPKDGSQFLIWTNRLGFAVVTHDVDEPMPTEIVPSGHHLSVDDGKHGPYPIRGDYPTHWMPLPPAPAAMAKEQS